MLVHQHIKSAQSVMSGVGSLLDESRSFAYTQAAWRFFRNESTTLPLLSAPLIEASLSGITHCKSYGLVVHDWSRLNYRTHESKRDKRQLSHVHDVGYELQSSLLLSDKTGLPIAPIAQNLVTSDKVYSSFEGERAVLETDNHLDELNERISRIEGLGFSLPLVHIIDREGDSVDSFRYWQAEGYQWLVRCRKNSTVIWNHQRLQVQALAKEIQVEYRGEVKLKGKKCRLSVGEVDVLLTRPSKRAKSGKKPECGVGVSARLVMSRVWSDDVIPQILAEWYLLTNVSKTVSCSEVAVWYCWRWQIESFFKLLKTQGFGLEGWQQETGSAIAKRLAVVCCACVTVWEIMHDTEAEPLKMLLIRLSGRQMKYQVKATASALLVGLWQFLSALDLLRQYQPEQLFEMAKMLPPHIQHRYHKNV
ncbi:MAG TPA: transposase [Agitococcus sp.]|nr:transposase [Agitococcus sp.]